MSKGYELTVLIKENQHSKHYLDKVQEIVELGSTKIYLFEDDGIKKLAYSINGEDEAHYYYWEFDTVSTPIAISKALDNTDGVIRYLLVERRFK